MSTLTEANYPVTFRTEDTKILGDHLRHTNSVNVIGMKRVGINHFLRFFFFNPEIQKQFLDASKKNFFVHIDLNDLVEREVYPFWTLTLKRMVDVIDMTTSDMNLKKQSKKLFVESIQLKDLFVTVDSVRKIASLLVESEYYPILVFNRFDRMRECATPEFFGNLQSLKDHAQRNLSFIFTSYRPLWELKPDVFTKQALSVFCQDMYLKPTKPEDSKTILQSLEGRYRVTLTDNVREILLHLSGGHAQYLHLSMIKLRDLPTIPEEKEKLLELLQNNEEANLLSEELFESLTKKEQEVLLSGTTQNGEAAYLKATGMITAEGGVFSPLFGAYLEKRGMSKQNGGEFTKKEHLLFTYLKAHEGDLCEREAIIEAVWPDYAESGVSDWAIDRLVARVRVKLKNQNSPYEITTVITRGYKMVTKS